MKNKRKRSNTPTTATEISANTITKTVGSGINLCVPNTIPEKMEAIVNLSIAVVELSKALASVHLNATILNNTICGADCGISIQG
jgi:hypothetical protein